MLSSLYKEFIFIAGNREQGTEGTVGKTFPLIRIIISISPLANLLRRCKAKLGGNGQFWPNGQSAKSGLNKSLQDAASINFLMF
ncbi:hypothetical protein [Okeania sp. SIO2B3]|uniref:hypothetical protein n=1 Tax=Okeania sp. SIO2B3 TaxID=2607784 RepID=UPI0013C1C8D3|nr:hypothetical protein [Okeania sp. SIO2B3]NET42414.1 hypothetical protein [Okeania sp. SIO2B3]